MTVTSSRITINPRKMLMTASVHITLSSSVKVKPDERREVKREKHLKWEMLDSELVHV
jgi:hypothetical protein